MIHKSKGMYALLVDMVPRLDVAHSTCVNIVAALRDPTTIIYSGPAPEPGPGEKTQSAEGWARHFSSEPVRLAAIKQVAGDAFTRNFSEMAQAEADYQATMPVIAALIQASIAAHGRNEPLTQKECDDLAIALEAQMEP